MSLYEVQHLIHAMNINGALQERFRAEPVALLAEYPLEDGERTMLLEGDLPGLWKLGVHPLLMLHYCRARRIPGPELYRQIGPLAGERVMRSAR